MISSSSVIEYFRLNPVFIKDRADYENMIIQSYKNLYNAINLNVDSDEIFVARAEKDLIVSSWFIAEEIHNITDSYYEACKAFEQAFMNYLKTYIVSLEAGINLDFKKLFESSYNVTCNYLEISKYYRRKVDDILMDFDNSDTPTSKIYNSKNHLLNRLIYMYDFNLKTLWIPDFNLKSKN